MVRLECDGYSGADLAALVREAGVVALKRTLGALDQMESEPDIAGHASKPRPKMAVTKADFVLALDKVGPSVSVAQRRRYETLRSKMAGSPVRIQKEVEKPADEKVVV